MRILGLLRQFWIPVVAGLVAISALSVLFNDHFLVRFIVQIPANVQKVGTTKRTNGSVRRQSYFLPLWLGLYQSDRLFDGDRIFTEASSGATVSLMDTVDVSLAANTLIEISTEDGLPKLLVEQGATDVKFLKPGSFVFEMNGKTQTFAGDEKTELKIYFDEKTGSAQIQMLAGKGKLNETDAVAGDDLKVKADGTVDKITSSLETVAPVEDSILISPGSRVEFKWNSQGNVKAVKLTVMTADEKPQFLFDQSVSNNHFWYTFKSPGEYSWTIANDKADSTVKSITKHLQVRFNDRPLITSPRNGTKVDLGRLKLRAAVTAMTDQDAAKPAVADSATLPIRWLDLPNQEGFIIEMADNSDFLSPSRQEIAGNSTEEILKLKAGITFARIARSRKDGKALIWSPATAIDVSDTLERKLASKTAETKQDPGSFPYPKLSSVVFLRAPASIQIKPKATCTSSCKLIATVANNTQKAQFNRGESPELKVDLDPANEGEVAWTMIDGTDVERGQFELRAYTKANLDSAVKDRKAMEVLK